MKPTVVEFCTDPALLGLSLSPAQEALLRAIYALPASEEHLRLYQECTGRAAWPTQPFSEVTAICGARAGKDSRILAPTLCFEALFGGHDAHLHRGEHGIIPLVSVDQRSTRVAFGFVKDYLTRSPLLRSKVADVFASEIALTNNITVTCFPCTQRSLRGWSIPAAGLDEAAFFRLEGSADSDSEIQASVRRGMIGFGQTRLLKISTPYLRSGVVFEDFSRSFGQDDGDLLCWRASTALMNPSISAERLARERRLDPLRYSREYEAEFADDVDAFLPPDWIDRAITVGRHELPPQPGVTYTAAVDPSGGGADAFTFAIGHREGNGADSRAVVDVLRGWHRVGDNLSAVVATIAEVAKQYGCREAVGDRYAAGWVRERFADAGLRYRETAQDKAATFVEMEPLMAQGRVELPDEPHLRRELSTLERRPRPGGRVLVDHPRGGHDDHAAAVALVIVAVMDAAAGRGSLTGAGFRRSAWAHVGVSSSRFEDWGR
jgi:hypothetical protein